MNAETQLIAYANSRMGRMGPENMTPQEWIGMAVREGIVFDRAPNSRTWCSVRREGRTIIVTETLLENGFEERDGKLYPVETQTHTEIMRIQL